MKYDLSIAHRVCPALSKTAVGFADKRTMVEMTAKSLREAISDLRVKLTVILDGCDDYEPVFRDVFATCPCVDMVVVRFPGIGNQATYGKQIELLAAEDVSEFAYFSEDDYLYRPDAFRTMLDFARRSGADMITPIDHPDRYNGVLERERPVRLKVTKNCHWREVGSSCLTFLVRVDVLKRCRRIFESYVHSTEEATMWLGLTHEGVFEFGRIGLSAVRHFVLRQKVPFGDIMSLCTWKRQGLKLLTHRRCRLWSPIPTLAVHLSNMSLPLHADEFFDDGRQDVKMLTERYLGLD